MNDLKDLVVDHVVHKLKVQDFHRGMGMLSEWSYQNDAESAIDRMTNLELLAAVGAALEWRSSGEEIGL